jgi:hypothetical protein
MFERRLGEALLHAVEPCCLEYQAAQFENADGPLLGAKEA